MAGVIIVTTPQQVSLQDARRGLVLEAKNRRPAEQRHPFGLRLRLPCAGGISLPRRDDALDAQAPRLQQRVETLISEINDQLDREVKGIQASMEAKLDATMRAVADLQKQIEEATERSTKELAATAPYSRAKRDLETYLRQREVMQMQLNEQLVNSQLVRDSSVEIIDRALPGLTPVRPNKPLFIAAGGVAGLLLGFLLAFFIEYLDTSVKTIDDVEQALGAPVLGVIPQNVGALINEGADSPHAEAYRVLRTNILFSRKDTNWRTMTVVSGGAGEGKSTTIFN
jgi:hypothetical protein